VLDSYRELLDMLVGMPVQLQTALDQAGDPPAGEWDAAQILGHMVASERMFSGWLNQLLNERDPLLREPKADHFAMQDELMQQPAAQNMDAFNSARGDTITLLMGLSLRDWEKAGVDARDTEISVDELVEAMVDHDVEHLTQMQALAKR
jgi:hypothetical protein